jgi:Na+/H+-dicarboxylate symporter
MVVGVAAGLVLKERAVHVKIVGDLFIRLLKMVIIPLITASMVCGVVSIGNVRALGRIGLRTFVYFLATTLIAVAVGLVLVNALRPGDGFQLPVEQAQIARHEPATITSILTDIIPDNVIGAAADSKFLSVIFFSLVLGVGISLAGEKAKPLANLFEALNAVMLKITGWIMCLAPAGVFALMAYVVGTLGWEVIVQLARYMATVLLGLIVHGCVILPLTVLILARCSPLRFVRHMFSALATAFSTASSAAALPLTMECLEVNAGISNKVTSFVAPLGATVNMNGTALYEAVAAMFIAQAYGMEMTLGHQLTIMVTATLAAVGAAAIPSAGLVTMVIVLNAVRLPVEGIAVIFAVDRILDMCRTTVNVWGDCCGAAVIARFEGETINQ